MAAGRRQGVLHSGFWILDLRLGKGEALKRLGFWPDDGVHPDILRIDVLDSYLTGGQRFHVQIGKDNHCPAAVARFAAAVVRTVRGVRVLDAKHAVGVDVAIGACAGALPSDIVAAPEYDGVAIGD